MAEKIERLKNHCTFIGAHVAGPPTYTPPYLRASDGKLIREMCTMNVYDGNVKFKMTGWGKMADIMAKSCATGKKVTIECEAKPFLSPIPTPGLQPGQPLTFVTGADQQPIQTEKMGFKILSIDFGKDSNKTITEEIRLQMRPAYWSVLGHADNAQWLNVICAQRNASVFVIGGVGFDGQPGYGFARVRQPNGQVVDPATIQKQPVTNAPVNTGTAAVAPVHNAQAVQTQASPVVNGFQGVPGQPTQVVVQGQNMGYANQQVVQQPAGAAQVNM